MKKRFPLITGILLLLFGAVLYINQIPFFTDLSRRIYDLFLKNTAVPVQSDVAVVVDIDDASLAEYGQWPWPRTRLAELVSTLWENGAAVVVFDIIFIEPDRTSPKECLKHWKQELGGEVDIRGISSDAWNFDSVFADSLRGGASVLGCFMAGREALPAADDYFYRGHFFEKGIPARNWLPQAGSSLQPLSELAQAAEGLAFINTQPDPDNLVRRTPLVFTCGPNRVYPSLSLEAIRLYAQAQKIGIMYDPEGVAGVQYLQVGDVIIPTEPSGRLVLNYRSTRIPHYSVYDILNGRLVPGEFRDKIVFIGTSAAGLNDLVSTPLSREFPGVEVHATVVDNVMAGDILREPLWGFTANLLAMLVGGVIVTISVVYASALFSFILMLLADITVIGASLWFLSAKQLVVSSTETIFVWGLVFTGVIAVKYWQEERERKKIRGMFGTMVSPDVLTFLEQSPESFSLSGERAEATILFSDIAEFTTISETMEPAQLAKLLNRYLSPMTEIIMARGGYVDKYEGDAIMAEWGVPFPVEDHAVQACYAALEQQEKLADLRATIQAEFGCELTVRLGINTGVVTAGNMGSERRFQYTVMGDVVNQASRFESGSKRYGVQIMIGEATRNAIGDLFEVRQLDRLVVKGKTQSIHVYELLACAGGLSAEKTRVVTLYEEALVLHWSRKFKEAAVKLDEALSILEDAPSQMLKDRIMYYIEHPPPPDWCGVFVNAEK